MLFIRTMKNHLSIVQCEYFEHRNLTTVNKYIFCRISYSN